jgi:hypothetical protein
MDNHSAALEKSNAFDAGATNQTMNTIDFHSIIDMQSMGGKNAKLDIDSTVSERPTANGLQQVAVNEKVMLKENGHTVPEHVLNNLVLTEHGKNLTLNDNTTVHAGLLSAVSNKAQGEAASEHKSQAGASAPNAPEHAAERAVGHQANGGSQHAADVAGDTIHKEKLTGITSPREATSSGESEAKKEIGGAGPVSGPPSDNAAKGKETLDTKPAAAKELLPALSITDQHK